MSLIVTIRACYRRIFHAVGNTMAKYNQKIVNVISPLYEEKREKYIL